MRNKEKLIELYDLCGENDLRFSPPYWIVKLCLIHKNLKFKTTPIRFTEKKKIQFSGQNLVPIITFNKEIICES